MKKLLVFVAILMATIMSAKAEVNFAYDAGAEIVSAFIWRGQYNGGLSFQPTADIGFNALDENIAFRLGAWGSIGASDWKFRKGLVTYTDADGSEINPNTYFIPEIDIFGSIALWGVTLGFTHYYYFKGTPYFAKLEDDGGSQTEIQVGYNTGSLIPGNLYFNWYTMIAGNDAWYDKNEDAHRAWSSYLELGYDYTFEDHGITIGGQLGMSPWKSDVYSNEKFAVINISLKIDKEWEFNYCTIDLFAQGSLNPDGVNKYNAYINAAGDEKLYLQKLNGVIGIGFWF